ncbi:MAG: LPS export ABC transporter periplasmic protein LptC [Desulfarculaceae bacterium]|nr:LPS export ABC transporter periplasmic protein LptC [Desulfarculaceae bacterium]MCF8072324.1 LPS export ABC transporter periplasmic protein LptC [Desulfarculaceae bacterium]MCF8100245.1 LPS export ABC transporter periplasmic protein LptC [Desulfarculaceae bacterium]MCF8116182.1 LPS export ABC transporter periplasmic protein LptC [Desulfarculaceae bacterium]
MKRLRWIILAVLVAVVAGALAAAMLHKPAQLPALKAGDEAPTDSDGRPRLHGLKYTHVENGVRKWSLKANRARYEENTSQVFLDQVAIEFYREKAGPIYLRGDEGVYNQKTQTVTLKGHVDGRTSEGDRLSTTVITYREKDKVAETDAEVTFEGSQYKVVGQGMRVLVDKNIVILKRNVRSTFRPRGSGPPPGATVD